MTLGDLQYGFLDPGSLFVFVDPYSPFPPVRERLLGPGASFERATASLGELTMAERADLLQRLTAVVHERQHFHDLVMTPHGVTIAYSSLLVGMRTVPVVLSLRLKADAMRVGGRVSIQLPLTDAAQVSPAHLDELRSTFGVFRDLVNRGRATLELSAILTQLTDLGASAGESAQSAVLLQLSRHAVYSELFIRLSDAFVAAKVSAGDAYRAARVLVVAALCTTNPDDALRTVLGRLESVSQLATTRGANAPIMEFVDRSEKLALGEIARRSSEAERLTQAIRDHHGQFSVAQDLYAPFLRAAEDLARLVKSAQHLWRGGITSVIGSLSDTTSDLPEPYFYAYSAFPERALTESPAVDYAKDDLFELQHIRRPQWPIGKQQTALLLQPIELFHVERAGERRLTKPYWLEMAKSGAGATSALLQPIDRTDPLQRLWLRTTGDALGVRFIRKPIRRSAPAAPGSPDPS